MLNIDDIDVDVQEQNEEQIQQNKQQNTLKSLDLEPDFEQHLRHCGFSQLTAIQQQSIPLIVSGNDTVIISHTGSGKTLAFLVPLIQKLQQHSQIVGIRSVILSPTRELALQTCLVLKKLIKFQKSPLRVALITGGDSLEDQFRTLTLNPDILVATPGRLVFHTQQIQCLKDYLKAVQYLVIDECDAMLEQQLAPQIQEIIAMLHQPQMVLCSATLPKQLSDFYLAQLKQPKLIQNEQETFPQELFLMNIYSQKEYKEATLYYILQLLQNQKLNNKPLKTLVFLATKYHCEYMTELFISLGFKCQSIFGALDQGTRNILLQRFRDNDFNIMFATDVAARGVDIEDLECVINFNFPFSAKVFLHRGGRCARNGRYGVYINIVDSTELCYLLDSNIHVGGQVETIDIENYLIIKEFGEFQFTQSDDFVKDNKILLRQFITNKFDKESNQTEELKQQYEEQYHKLSKLLSTLQSNSLQHHNYIQNYIDNCQKLQLNPFTVSSFFNFAMTHSRVNNSLSVIPQQIIDFQYQKINTNPFSQGYNSTKNAMINSMQQLNKQRKSATEASVQRAKELQNDLSKGKHYSILFFDIAKQQGSEDIVVKNCKDVIENYKVSTEMLKQRASKGDKESQVQLKVREFIDQKTKMQKALQDIRQHKEQEDNSNSKNLHYNNPETIRRLDEEIDHQKQQPQQSLALVPLKHVKTNEEQLQMELQKDELTNISGQRRPKEKVWDKNRGRYVSQESMNRKHEKVESKVMNDKNQWETAQKKNLYQKWVKKSQQKIQYAGQVERVNDNQAQDELKYQGLGRVQKRIQEQRSHSQGRTQKTTVKDKQKLNEQFQHYNNFDEKKSKLNKAYRIQQQSDEVKRKGLDWKKYKQDQQKYKKNVHQGYEKSQDRRGGQKFGRKMQRK